MKDKILYQRRTDGDYKGYTEDSFYFNSTEQLWCWKQTSTEKIFKAKTKSELSSIKEKQFIGSGNYEREYNLGDGLVSTEEFGKITGVDKVNDSFMVSIGTNTSGNLIIQSLIWLLFFMLIPSHKKNNKFSSKLLIFIPLIFIFQYIAESRFYNRTNFLYNNELSFSNYYLIGNLIFYTFITLVIKDEFQTRYNNLINFIPFIFLISGTFSGMNLNIYLII